MSGTWYHQEVVATVLAILCFYAAVLIPAFEMMVGLYLFMAIAAICRNERRSAQ